MHLMYYTDSKGNRVYTLKVISYFIGLKSSLLNKKKCLINLTINIRNSMSTVESQNRLTPLGSHQTINSLVTELH